VLDTVPTAYSHDLRAELLYELCTAFVREGLAGPATWEKCEGSSVAFAQRAIVENIGEERRDLLQRNVEYHLSVSDVAERDGEDAPLGKGCLSVTIECGGAGYLKIGPAIAALEGEAAGLGAAFYWTLTYALYRVMRIYNHDDALQYEEQMRESVDDDEENRGQYEFPKVEEALPECVRNTLKRDDHLAFVRHSRQLLMEHRHGRFHSWIERLRSIDRLSRIRLRTDACFRVEGGYDTIPLPSLVIAFKDHDAIVACFDEESQYMLEGSAEPALGVVFSPDNPDEVKTAIRAVRRFAALNVALFEMVEELAEWEKCDAGTCLDRGEPSLRAARGASGLRGSAAELCDEASGGASKERTSHARGGTAADSRFCRVTGAIPLGRLFGRSPSR
jgi:hypothetical protein